jgi:Phosphotransferase enzyme family
MEVNRRRSVDAHPGSGVSSGRTPPVEPVLCPIELLHPDGEAGRRAVLGSNCPRTFCPAQPSATAGTLDLLVVAPDPTECRDADFFERAVGALSGRLSSDGLGYVFAPARWRHRLRRRLRGEGFLLGPIIAHLPPGKTDQYLVPGERGLLRYTVSSLTSLSPARCRAAEIALQVPGILSLIARLLPEVGIIVRRMGARPLFQWLGVEGGLSSTAVIRTKWRAQGGTAQIHCFSRTSAKPSAVGKVALSARLAGLPAREARALQALGPMAARSGIRIPTGSLVQSPTGRPLLLASYLPGRRAASLLASGRADGLAVLTEIAAWLKEWNRSTVVSGVLDRRRLVNDLLAPAEQVAPFLTAGAGHVSWLRELGAAALGRPLSTVAAHNDLTMQNVLLEAGMSPAVIDWESASEDGLPLADFFYAAVDVFLAADRIADRKAAFLACFSRGAPRAESVARLGDEIRQAVELPVSLVPICFHACWVRHAADESEQIPDARDRPFLAIVDWIAANPGNVRLPGCC